MASSRKHGTHSVKLNIPAAAAGSAADVIGDSWAYEAFAGSSLTAQGGGGLSAEQEWLLEAVVTTYAVLTGQATNFSGPRLTLIRNGVVINQMRIDFSAAGVVTAAQVPVNLGVAAAAVATGAGTGVLTVSTGVALPWALQNGDVITFDRLSNNATGLATPAMSCTIKVGAKS